MPDSPRTARSGTQRQPRESTPERTLPCTARILDRRPTIAPWPPADQEQLSNLICADRKRGVHGGQPVHEIARRRHIHPRFGRLGRGNGHRGPQRMVFEKGLNATGPSPSSDEYAAGKTRDGLEAEEHW